MKLFMVDGIGPFFRGYARHRINWSKIPFDNMEFGGEFDAGRFAGIREDFIRFADAVAELGFNGITLDDLAHLSPHAGYSDRLASKVRRYRDAYAGLFEIAAARGLTPYVTTDVMFAPSGHPELWGDLRRDGMLFLRDACESLFKDFPLVGGVIFRMGECDGRDVRGDFTSRLAIRTPSQARDFLRAQFNFCSGCTWRTRHRNPPFVSRLGEIPLVGGDELACPPQCGTLPTFQPPIQAAMLRGPRTWKHGVFRGK